MNPYMIDLDISLINITKEGRLISFIDKTKLSESDAKTTGDDLYYLKLSVPSIKS